MTAPDIVVVGAASRDLRPSDPRGWRLGGAVTYSARLLGQLGMSVGALIGVDGEASEAHELDELRVLGVVTETVALEQGPVFDNRQTSAGRVQIAHGISDEVPPEALPTAWQTACAYLLDPVAGEIGQDWAEALPSDALVALGYQGLLRTLRPGAPVEARPLVLGPLSHRADLAALSSEDVRAGAPPLRRLLARDEQCLVVTEGSLGALHVRRSNGRFLLRFVPAVPARGGVDATGAGDTFLAAWLAAMLTLRTRGRADARCLALAALCSSLLVEGNGVSRKAIRDRSALLKLRDAGSS